MIKQIFVDGVFFRLMDDDETNDEQELQAVKDLYPESDVVIIQALDGSNQHEPLTSEIITLDEPTIVLDPLPHP